MTHSQTGSVICPACGKHYRFRAELAGRRVRCTCSQVITMPAQPPASAAPTPAGRHAASPGDSPTIPSVHQAPAKKEPVEPLGGMLAAALSPRKTEVERAIEAHEDEVQESLLKDRYLPIALAVSGAIGAYTWWLVLAPSTSQAIIGATASEMMQVIVYLPLALGAAFVTASAMGVSFGEFYQSLFKLAAISIGPGALADAAYLHMIVHSEFDFRATLIGFVIGIIGFAGPLYLLFDLDFYETMLTTVMVVTVRTITVFLLALMIHGVLLA